MNHRLSVRPANLSVFQNRLYSDNSTPSLPNFASAFASSFPHLSRLSSPAVETVGSSWSKAEVEAVVAAYREMLALQLSDQPYNKRQRNLALQRMTGRSAGSIERKHQNISAVLNSRGFFYIPGYKPLGNYQSLLHDVVAERIIDDPVQQALAIQTAGRTDFSHIALPVSPADLLAMLTLAPVPALPAESFYRRAQEGGNRPFPTDAPRAPRDYLALEARNALLGSSGEELVMNYEHQRLWTEGAKHLAERIERVSATLGDHLGYDIRSYETNGKERLIEVKTTQSGAMTPFFLTANELQVSTDHADHYFLYRLYEFSRKPKLYQLQGSLSKACRLEPIVYRGMPG